MIENPSYIPISLIQNQPIKYTWNDWDPYAAVGEPSEETAFQLSQLSNRAIISFSIGCAEWVIYRFKELKSDTRPYDYLEALWAFEMSKEIMLPPESNEDEWQGRILAPVDLAIVTVFNTVNQTEYEIPDLDAAFAERIAIYVLGDSEPFLKWKSAVMPRLESLFPRDGKDPWGLPVPREVLDPTVELRPEILMNLVNRFLKSLHYDSNKFIRFIETSQ